MKEALDKVRMEEMTIREASEKDPFFKSTPRDIVEVFSEAKERGINKTIFGRTVKTFHKDIQ